MKLVTKIAVTLLLVFINGNFAWSANQFPCSFDSFVVGDVSFKKVPEGYELDVDQGGDGYFYTVKTSDVNYKEIEEFAKKPKEAEIPPEGALLMYKNEICGFVPVYRQDNVVLQNSAKIRLINDEYLVPVGVYETSDNFNLYISKENLILFNDTAQIESDLKTGINEVVYTGNYQIVEINKTENRP